MDRQPRRLAFRRHPVGQLSGLRSRSGQGPHRGLRAPGGPRRRRAGGLGLRPIGDGVRGAVLGGSGAYQPTADDVRQIRETIRKVAGPAQRPLLVAVGGDDRSAPERFSRHPAGRPGRRGILLQRGIGRAGRSRTRGSRASSSSTPGAALATQRRTGRRIPPGQRAGRELRPVQAILRTAGRPDAGRARLGRLPDSGPGLAGRGRAAVDHRRGGAVHRAARARHRHRRIRGRGVLPAVLLEPLPGRHGQLAGRIAVRRRRRLPAVGGVRDSGLRHFRSRRRGLGAGLAGPGQPDLHLAAERISVRPAYAIAAGGGRGLSWALF